jgi:type VI protein secretion system component VasK
MKLVRQILIILTLVFAANSDLLAQRKKEKNKVTPESGAEKEASAKAEKQAQYKSRKDHHLEVQDKATRKRMKKTKKKAERHSWGKDVPWYKRWFRKDNFH